jgi:hypothetical protein
MKRTATVSVLILLTALSAAAQQPLEYKVTVLGEAVKGSASDHFLTFSGPFQIPEVTLPAGTYVFTLVAPSVVRVSSPDRSQQYATFFTAPVALQEAGNEYQMEFERTDAAAPARIAKWFLPNKASGFEFLYPKVEAAGER